MAVVDSYSESNYTFAADLFSTIPAIGQSFTGDGSVLGLAKFYMKKQGSPTGNVYAKVYTHSGIFGTSSEPTGSALAISDAFDVSTLTTSNQLITFTFGSSLTLTNGTKYCITAEYSGGDAADKAFVGRDSTGTHGGNFIYYYTGSWGYNAAYDTCFYIYGKSTETKAVTAKGRTQQTESQAVTSKGNIFNEVTQTATSKGSIKILGVTQTVQAKGRTEHPGVTKTITTKGNVQVTTTKTITPKAKIKATVTWAQTTAKGRIFTGDVTWGSLAAKACIVTEWQTPQPRLGTAILPFPSKATIRQIKHIAKVTTMSGKDKKDSLGTKYRYTLKWSVMKPDDFDPLLELVKQKDPMLFTYKKWPQSENGVYVLGKLSPRKYVTGTGITDYWSSVSLTLTEVYNR